MLRRLHRLSAPLVRSLHSSCLRRGGGGGGGGGVVLPAGTGITDTGGSQMLSVGANLSQAESKRRVDDWRRPYSPSIGSLTASELDQFFTDGFVIKRDLFPRSELTPVIRSVEGLVDSLASDLFRAGKIKDLCAGLGFHERMTALEKQLPGCSVLLHKQGILPSAVSDLWCHPKLLDCAEQLVGPNISGHPVWNLRVKTPSNAGGSGTDQATVPWHQDNAYLQPTTWSHLTATAWIPLVDATRENGCMQVVKGGHRTGLTALHTACAANTWYLDLSVSEIIHTLSGSSSEFGAPLSMSRDVVTCEVPMGSVLFLNNLIPHRSLENRRPDQIRWSLDLRWMKTGADNGFYGLKDSIRLRKQNDKSYRPDWNTWNESNRHTVCGMRVLCSPHLQPIDLRLQTDAYCAVARLCCCAVMLVRFVSRRLHRSKRLKSQVLLRRRRINLIRLSLLFRDRKSGGVTCTGNRVFVIWGSIN